MKATNNVTAHQMTASEYAAYRAGFATGREQMRAEAAAVCQARAVLERERASKDMDGDSCGRALSREAGSKACAEAILALPLTADK